MISNWKRIVCIFSRKEMLLGGWAYLIYKNALPPFTCLFMAWWLMQLENIVLLGSSLLRRQ